MFRQLYSQPYLLLSLSALFWGGNAIVGRWLRDYVDAVDINLIRWLIALGLLLPFCLKPLLKEWAIVRRHLPLIALLGVMGVAVFQTLLYLAFQTTTAVNAALILSSCPVLITLGNGLLYREWLSTIASVGILISLCGTVILISHGELSVLQQLDFRPGDLWMLLASLIWAIYSIGLKHKPAQLSASSLLLSTVIIGLAVLIPFSLFYEEQRQLQSWTTGVYLNLFYLAIFPSVAAFICWNRGVALVGSSRAGIFLHLIPVFTAILSFLLLGEGVALYHLIGAGFVFGGIWLMTRKHL